MVSDRIETLLNDLICKTKNNKIKWRPIKEYIDTFISPKCEESYFAQYINAFYCLNQFQLHLDKSFFAKKDGYIIALLDIDQKSSKDGSINNCVELVGAIYNSPVKRFPEYIDGGFKKIQKSIIEYWESKEGDYNLEISDNFEILSVFTEED